MIEDSVKRLSMKKRSHYNDIKPASSHGRKGIKIMKAFKSRRQAIKNDDYSSKSLFGSGGCSSWYW